MPVFDARQVLGQRLTTSTGTRRARNAGRRHTFLLARQFGFGRRQIAGQGFLKQVALLGRERLAARAEAHPAQVRQLQREGLNLGVGGVKLRVTARDLLAQASGFGGFFLCLIDEALNGADDPFREFWSGLQADQFSMQIHAIIITDDRTKDPVNRAFQRYLFKLVVSDFASLFTPASAPAVPLRVAANRHR